MKRFFLREIAHARAGDKGDTSNIGVIAYRPEYFPLLIEQVTVERVRAHFGAFQLPLRCVSAKNSTRRICHSALIFSKIP